MPAAPGRRLRPSLRRWLRRIGLAMLALLLVVTAFSLGYNALTAKRASLPAGLSFVATGDTQTRYRQWGTGGPAGVRVRRAAASAHTPARGGPPPSPRPPGVALDLGGWGDTRP